MSDVFISYSRRDIAFARLIREALQQSDIDTWIDWDRIPVGERWWQEITGAIEGANIFMLIISRHSIGSKVCRDEIGLALANHKRIVPVLVDQLAPEEIAALAPDLPAFNWVVFERDKIFRLEVDPNASSEKAEDREVALAKMPQFEEALRKLSLAIHTDWEWVKYHTGLQVEALRWDKNQRDPSYVVRGTALEQAEQQLFRAAGRDPQPTSLQVEYVTASRQEEARRQQEKLALERKARRRQRYVLAAVAIGLLVSSSLGVVAWGQRNQALSEANARATAQAQTEEQRQVAVQQRQVAVSRQLAAQAVNQVEVGNPGLGDLLAIEAYQHADTMDARSSLLRAIQSEPRLRYFIYGHTDQVHSVAFSPNGRTIVSASEDGTIGLWDAASGKPAHAALTNGTAQATSAVLSLAVSHDGRYLASGDSSGKVRLWKVAQDYASTVIFTAATRPGFGDTPVTSLAFSPDSKSLAVGLEDKSVALLSVADGEAICPSMNGTVAWEDVVTVAFSPDGESLAIGNKVDPDAQGGLSWWDTATCQQEGQAVKTSGLAGASDMALTGMVNDVAYRPDGRQLAVAIGDSLVLMDPVSHEVVGEPVMIRGNNSLESIAYSPNGSLMALGIADGTIVILDSATGKQIGQPLIGSQGAVTSVAFAADGHSMASDGSHSAVLVWDLQNQSLLQTLRGHVGAVYSVAFSPDSKLFATAGEDQTIRLWDTSTWRQIGQPLGGHDGVVRALAFSPDGKVLASGGDDQLVHLWSTSTRQALATPLSGVGTAIYCLAFSPDGKWLAAGAASDRLTTWEAVGYTLTSKTQGKDLLTDDVKRINSLGFTPDSSTLYFTSGGGHTDFMPVSELTPGSVRTSLTTNEWTDSSTLSEDQIVGRVSPDGKTIALSNVQQTGAVQFYKVLGGDAVGIGMLAPADEANIAASDLMTWLAFTPDGRLLASNSRDGTINLWDTATEQQVGLPIAGHSQLVTGLAISADGKWLASSSEDGTVQVVDLTVSSWSALGCGVVRRNLYADEWQQFLPDEPYRPVCPGQPADPAGMSQLAALARTTQREGNAAEASTILADGLAWVTASSDSGLNNGLCWYGSLNGFAARVMPACERAVSLATPDQLASHRDSRGLARALTGNTSGAIDDFQAMVDWSLQHGGYATVGKQREDWIAALKAGKYPFDQKTLDSLQSQ